MKPRIVILTILAAAVAFVTPAEAKGHRHHHHHQYVTGHRIKPVLDNNGNVASPGLVVSRKTGAKTHVSSEYAGRFQALVDALEADGATIYTLGGLRGGHCSDGQQHACGKAMDVCQVSYGRVLAKCRLPSGTRLAQIARSVNLQSASEWCNPDTGHFQVTPTGCHVDGTMIASARQHRHNRLTYANQRMPSSDYMSRFGAGV